MRETKKLNIYALCQCGIFIALATILSFLPVYEMPMGGSVTIASMLPIMLVSIKYGVGTGLATAFAYSLTQLLQAVASPNVFPYCQTGEAVAICVLFDYVVPFTILGLAGIFHKMKLTKNTEMNIYIGIIGVVVLRFFCHFITGVTIWKQWTPEGMGKYLYSFLYNAGFLSVDFIICIVSAVLMFRKAELRKLVNID